MKHDWNVVWVKTVDYPDMPESVHSVRVECVGTDENNKVGRHEMLITFPQPVVDSFVPFDNVTKELVVSWFVDSLSDEHWEFINNNIAIEITSGVVKHEQLALIDL